MMVLFFCFYYLTCHNSNPALPFKNKRNGHKNEGHIGLSHPASYLQSKHMHQHLHLPVLHNTVATSIPHQTSNNKHPYKQLEFPSQYTSQPIARSDRSESSIQSKTPNSLEKVQSITMIRLSTTRPRQVSGEERVQRQVWVAKYCDHQCVTPPKTY